MKNCLFFYSLLASLLFSPFLLLGQDIRFYSKSIKVSVGDTFMLPFELAEIAKENKAVEFDFSADAFRLLEGGLVLQNFKTGFVRLQVLKSGAFEIKQGKNTIKVEAHETKEKDFFFTGAPVIVSPINGAVLNGKVHVGVKVLRRDSVWGDPAEKTFLKINKETTLKPIDWDSSNTNNNINYFKFELNAADFKDGEIHLQAIVLNRASEEIKVFIQNENSLVSVESENQVPKEERIDRWSKETPRIGASPMASGGKFILNYSQYPIGLNFLDIQEEGFYQFYIRAKGDKAGGAYPSVGLYFNKDNNARKAGRLFSSDWHRVAIGKPIFLSKGSYQLAQAFMNDFVAFGDDRNLYLDEFSFIKCVDRFQSSHLDLKVSFKNIFDGDYIQSDVIIPVVASWDNRITNQVPKISLCINDVVVREFFGKEPVLKLKANEFQKGKNKVQLKANFADSEAVYSGVQWVYKDFENANKTPYYQFSVNDDIWNGDWAVIGKRTQNVDEYLVEANGEITLKLPPNIKGRYQVALNCRGNVEKDSFFVSMNVGETPAKEMLANGWWRLLQLGEVSINEENRQIKIKINQKGNTNSKLWVKELILEEVEGENREPPQVAILYPKIGSVLSSDDLVIVRSHDDRKLRYVDLKINGNKINQELVPSEGFGDFIFCLPKHMLSQKDSLKIQAIAIDHDGNMAESELLTLKVNNQPSELSEYEKARLICQRAIGYFHLNTVGAILLEGQNNWLKRNFMNDIKSDSMLIAKDTSQVIYKNRFDYSQPSMQAIYERVKTTNPAHSYYVNWIQNHFSTWLQKVTPELKLNEYLEYQELGFGRFSDALLLSTHSAAMLNYLDQNTNRKSRVNENYARELMELHTLGVDAGYTQEDVVKLSKFLTGWNTTAEADLSGEGERLNSVFYFCNNFHESEEVDIFGVFYKSSSTAEESYERIRKMLEALSMHPLTAKFFCKKILGHFVRGAYSEKDLDELIAKYYECGGHVGELLVHLLQKDYFYNSSKDQYMIPPLDFAISVMANSTDPDIWAILNCGKKSGFGLFDSIDPSGHPEEDQYYADSNVILQCWRLSDQANWHLYRNLPESLHIARGKPEPEWMNDMIHTASMRLNGKSLDSNSYTVTKDYFKDLEGQTYLKVLGLVSFIKKLPVAYTK